MYLSNILQAVIATLHRSTLNVVEPGEMSVSASPGFFQMNYYDWGMVLVSSPQLTAITLSFVCIVMLAGCTLSGGNVETPTQTGTPTATVDPPTETACKTQTEALTGTATETSTPPPHQEQFISVDEVNTSSEWDEFNNTLPEDRVRFSNLSAADQQTFLEALNSTQTKRDSFPSVKFVEYNGIWYEITHIIEWVN